METVKSSLTVFFEAPFWVGVYEVSFEGKLCAARIVFGAEPKDGELYEWLLQNGNSLRLSPPVPVEKRPWGKISPKRMQRQIHRRLSAEGSGTKAQQALKLLQEQTAVARKVEKKERRTVEAEYQFRLKQEKKKEKRRGH